LTDRLFIIELVDEEPEFAEFELDLDESIFDYCGYGFFSDDEDEDDDD